jgi:hypothetical protein
VFFLVALSSPAGIPQGRATLAALVPGAQARLDS